MGGKPVAAFGESSAAYCFGPFRLEPETGLLFRDDQPVALTPKVFDALLYLVERSGRLVTKDDLMKSLWADAFVAESNLTQTVFVLRKALADNVNGQHYITTVPGRGYRFVAEVQRVSGKRHDAQAVAFAAEGGLAAAAQPAPELPIGSARREPRLVPRSRAFLTATALAMLVIATVAAYLLWWGSRDRLSQANGRKMLAVLPFENLTGDASQDYFSDGLTEEMITQLGRLDPQRMGVIARTSVMHYKHRSEGLDQIARELGVQYVLEGSIRRDAGNVRISAQLIQVKDQTHLWAREYDRKPESVLVLQGEIAQEVADEIQTALGAGKRAAPLARPAPSTQSYEAYDLYLKGRYFWNKRTKEGFQQAIDSFQQAVEKDLNYARAYAGLADSYALMSDYSFAPPDEVVPKARAAALRALQIDEKLAEAHASLALITENHDRDWQTAEKEFRKAIELDPNYATGHHWYAEYLGYQGRFDEALAESERARQLDPLSLIIAADNGAILYLARQYDRAIQQFRAVLAMEPSFRRAHELIILSYVQKRQFADALADLEQLHRGREEPWMWAWSAYVYGSSGQPAQAQLALKKLAQANRKAHMYPASMLALASVGMGNKDEAIVWLQRAYLEHSNALTALKVEPAYDSLRADPRFQELVRRVGLVQ